ncbi:MAG: 4Fe-4S binding protein [Myxococcales bacterium]|nr:4Fe-4S binding protein [Myxococcales bacterium]
MSRKPIVIIEPSQCTGCGHCVAVCPADTLALKDGVAHVVGERSLHCGHCVAICPAEAIRMPTHIAPGLQNEALPPPAQSLLRTASMRRSCRNYLPKPVDAHALQSLVNFAAWAPSGTNSQKTVFTLVPNRKSVEALAQSVGHFYRRTNRLADNPLARAWSKVFLHDTLGRYRKRYYRQVSESLAAWDEHREDQLFHGATAAIVISVARGASCPAEDALLAAQNILLAAETLKLGTCLIGFAVEAMKRDRDILRQLGIAEDETVYAVIALGWPQYAWLRPAVRPTPRTREFWG